MGAWLSKLKAGPLIPVSRQRPPCVSSPSVGSSSLPRPFSCSPVSLSRRPAPRRDSGRFSGPPAPSPSWPGEGDRTEGEKIERKGKMTEGDGETCKQIYTHKRKGVYQTKSYIKWLHSSLYNETFTDIKRYTYIYRKDRRLVYSRIYLYRPWRSSRGSELGEE